jgi:hypothetical protein
MVSQITQSGEHPNTSNTKGNMMNKKYLWPVTVIVCVSIITLGLYFGLSNSADRAVWTEYCKAAVQGDASAQCELGIMYAEGRGVPQDDAEAVRWYRKAAEQGSAAGQFHLGVAYRMGCGVPKNDAHAVHWYHISAKKGYPKARDELRRRGLSWD